MVPLVWCHWYGTIGMVPLVATIVIVGLKAATLVNVGNAVVNEGATLVNDGLKGVSEITNLVTVGLKGVSFHFGGRNPRKGQLKGCTRGHNPSEISR